MVSDIALLKELPAAMKSSIAVYVGCIDGATTKKEYLATVEAAGFQDVDIVNEVSTGGIYDRATVQDFAANLGTSSGTISEVARSIISMQVRAIKPN